MCERGQGTGVETVPEPSERSNCTKPTQQANRQEIQEADRVSDLRTTTASECNPRAGQSGAFRAPERRAYLKASWEAEDGRIGRGGANWSTIELSRWWWISSAR